MEVKSKVLSGSPHEILDQLSGEIMRVVSDAGISPHSLNILAMLDTMFHALMNLREQNEKGDFSMGKAPSNKIITRIVAHGLAGHEWTKEEMDEFGREFVEMVSSMGGKQITSEEMDNLIKTSSEPMFMAPPSKEVH